MIDFSLVYVFDGKYEINGNIYMGDGKGGF